MGAELRPARPTYKYLYNSLVADNAGAIPRTALDTAELDARSSASQARRNPATISDKVKIDVAVEGPEGTVRTCITAPPVPTRQRRVVVRALANCATGGRSWEKDQCQHPFSAPFTFARDRLTVAHRTPPGQVRHARVPHRYFEGRIRDTCKLLFTV